jgi:thioredoxin family protein
MSTWNAYNNQYWPAEYLVDQSGRVAYMHFGEGEYDVTESAIAALLGIASSPTPVAATPDVSAQTPELYAGSGRGQLADGESYGAAGKSIQYPDPGPPRDNDKILVTGTWADQGEYLVAASPGHVRLSFSARDVYLVAGQNGQTVHAVDGAAVPASQRGPDLTASGLDVTGQQLYHLLQNQGGNRHLIDLTVPDGFRLYTFTFG